jgi:hypothetical protein
MLKKDRFEVPAELQITFLNWLIDQSLFLGCLSLQQLDIIFI